MRFHSSETLCRAASCSASSSSQLPAPHGRSCRALAADRRREEIHPVARRSLRALPERMRRHAPGCRLERARSGAGMADAVRVPVPMTYTKVLPRIRICGVLGRVSELFQPWKDRSPARRPPHELMHRVEPRTLDLVSHVAEAALQQPPGRALASRFDTPLVLQGRCARSRDLYEARGGR